LLLAASLLFYRGVLAGTHVIPWDLPAYHLPFSYLAHDALREGSLPLWDPFSYCGRPIAANPQAQVFYPPRMLTTLLGLWTGERSLFLLLELLVMAHMWLAGVTAYRLARSAKLTIPAALMTAVVYQMGGFMAAHGEHLGAVCAAAWLPLAVQSAWKARPAILSATLAMTLLAGFTPMTVVAWAVAFVFALPRPRVLVAFPAAAILALVQLGPSVQLMQSSVAKYRTDWLGDGGGIPWAALGTLIDPNRPPPAGADITFWYLYCGWLALPLAALGAAVRPSLLFMTASSAVLMSGSFFQFLPDLVRRTYYPEYVAAPFMLGIATLAGFGLNSLLRSGGAPYLLVVVALTDLLTRSSGRPMNAMPKERETVVTRSSFPEIQKWKNEPEPGRVESGPSGLLVAMTAPITMIYHANGYDPMALESYMAFRLRYLDGKRWGAYYEVASPDSPLLAETGARLLVSGTGIAVVKNPGPRFRLVHGAVRVVKFGMSELILETDSPADDRLTSAEVHYPGSRAWIDGREQTIEFDRGTFRSHRVPAGRHTVVWRFWPALAFWCGAISLLAWAGWVVACLRWRGRDEA
jgi:hypothetical protein